MKTFNDLVFAPHPHPVSFIGVIGDRAALQFDNGFGVSVLKERREGLYEIAVLRSAGTLHYCDITDGDVLRYRSADQITEVMRKVQELTP